MSLNGTNGQSEYVVDDKDIPMRPLMLAPGNNGSNRNLPSYGVATRGGGSYLLQPPGERKGNVTLDGSLNIFPLFYRPLDGNDTKRAADPINARKSHHIDDGWSSAAPPEAANGRTARVV